MLATLARLGYASKALIYFLIGFLALSAALNRGGRVTDRSGALREVLRQPYGILLLYVLALGLCGYAAWRILDAIFDPDRHGTSFGGLVERIGNAVRALIYGALGVEAFRLAQGLRTSSDGAELWVARIMRWPLGDWIVGAFGLIVIAYGISEIMHAVKEKAQKSIDVSVLPARWRGDLLAVARFGVAARAVIIVGLGFFLVRAAMRHDPSEAADVRESMLEIANIMEGRWMLAALAVGLMAYALDQALHARCRRIRSPI